VLGDHYTAIISKHLHVQVSCDAVRMAIDANQFSIIVDNLVSNAIKFSPENGTIRIVVEQTDTTITLNIHDDGCGISRAEAERIFEPFFRGDASHHGKVAGTGLGLSIVNDYAVRLGGSVELIDASRGAHFRLRLPV
jgi:two-component system sensor histidine kinase GlrK